ncbi:kinase-like protein [Xylariaceae sp. AK1471]|nr:kinase-like protein [Xylariaceae sp. AK1471]
MDSDTPLELPYFAPSHILPAPLPNPHQILSSRDFLTPITGLYGTRGQVVVRVGEHFIVKYGKNVKQLEGENMLFVKKYTTIPVPQLYAMKTYDEDKTMLIMENIKGITLRDYMRTMTPTQLQSIGAQLRAQLNELRRIPVPVPGYYGSLGHRPLYDIYRNREYGPFDTVTEAITANFKMMLPPRTSRRFTDIIKFFAGSFELVATALGHTHPVFSHADLHEENILVRPDGTPVIIDYETAGFYPAYHEYLNATLLDDEIDFLDKFPEEHMILTDAYHAWEKAENEEPDDDSEAEDDSEPDS